MSSTEQDVFFTFSSHVYVYLKGAWNIFRCCHHTLKEILCRFDTDKQFFVIICYGQVYTSELILIFFRNFYRFVSLETILFEYFIEVVEMEKKKKWIFAIWLITYFCTASCRTNQLNYIELNGESLTQSIITLESDIFSSVQRMFVNMTQLKQLYCGDTPDPKPIISHQLKYLKPSEMLGVYVRAQNCGLFIHMLAADEVTLSTFSASLPNEVIYGDSINGDIQVIEKLLLLLLLLANIIFGKFHTRQRIVGYNIFVVWEMAREWGFLFCVSRLVEKYDCTSQNMVSRIVTKIRCMHEM